jgi:uncharacterized SAM-binding protein YcdF (DUF218 family)
LRKVLSERARRRASRVLLWGVIGLTGWVVLAVLVDLYGRAHEKAGSFDAIVVAGARVWRGGRPSRALSRRTQVAIELWKSGHAPLLVFTGGVGQHPPAEAEVAARLAREQGVPESALRIENRSRNTLENAAFARELLGARRVLVVTDAYHVLRCELVYRHYFPEVGVVGIPIGRTPPMEDALTEVLAIAALPFAAGRRWFLD